jgi:hypothetical protein
MFEEPPPPAEPVPILAEAEAPQSPGAEGRVVIDLTRLVPPPPAEDCLADDPDPLNPAILVCETTGPSPRLGPMIGPVDEEFGSAIPRARIKLSENAEGEANLHNTPVGGFNANGGELRLKIDF